MLTSYAAGAIFGSRTGAGPPQVLALHGWGRSRDDFADVLAGLDAIAVDLPGFGASPAPTAPTGSAGYAAVVAEVLDEFPEPAVVVGHSFGGRVAVHLALLRPDKVRALVLVGVPLVKRTGRGRVRSPWPYRVTRTLHRFGVVNEERMEAARQRYGSADYRAARGVMRDVLVAVVNESYEEELPRISQPVFLVWGADDRDVPPQVAESAGEIFSRSELTVLTGVGHHVCLEAPETVRAAILAVGP